MTTVEVSKDPVRYTTVTKTKTVSSVEKPIENTVEIHDPGVSGPPGTPNTLTVGSVTAGDLAVTITGESPNQVINFVIPSGGYYVHNQISSSDTWAITHNLGFYPAVTIVDSGGHVVIGDVTYVSANALTVSFNATFGGKAYLS